MPQPDAESAPMDALSALPLIMALGEEPIRALLHPHAAIGSSSSTFPDKTAMQAASASETNDPIVSWRLSAWAPRPLAGGWAFAGSRRRIAPTCAGNRLALAKGAVTLTVHPRGCGEQIVLPPAKSRFRGSSPRVRGTGVLRLASQHARRFIPAGAGNREIQTILPCRWPVHPRGCGEQPLERRLRFAYCGSSPRVRGTGIGVGVVTFVGRFIPAGAGNSLAGTH